MPAADNPLGDIEITPAAIASIARLAALQSYGVVGMASKGVMDGLANRLAHDPRHGVEVVLADGDGAAVSINLYITVEYGTRISSVATSVANSVRFNVEKALGMPIGEVNVHVQGLRVSNPDV